MENLFILPVALVIDLTLGEYPSRLHPVVWIGKIITLLLKTAPRKNNHKFQFIYGVFIVCFTIVLFSVPLYFLLDALNKISMVA